MSSDGNGTTAWTSISADEHERPGGPEVAQLLPQLPRVAAHHVRHRVAQRRHHEDERASARRPSEREEHASAAGAIHARRG